MLVNVSRGLSSPITLGPDHNDVLAARDTGFIQIHVETCQEVLDSVLMAFRIAEDSRVSLPTLVNLDGLINSTEYFIHLQNASADEYLESIGLDYVFGNAYILQRSNPYQWNFEDRLEEFRSFEVGDSPAVTEGGSRVARSKVRVGELIPGDMVNSVSECVGN